MKIFFLFLTIFTLTACATAPPSEERSLSSLEIPWRNNGGIETAFVGEKLMVVRADPRVTPLELVNPPQTNSLSVQQVADRFDFKVVINAAMFATDYVTSVGYMRNFDYVNNPNMPKKFGGFIFFNPKKTNLPAVKIGTRSELNNYHTAFQTYRMWDIAEGILWKKGKSIFHHVGLVGVDGKNRVLFFYHPNPIDVHDLVAQILALSLDLKGLLYLDGGTHGALYLAPELGEEWNTRISLPNLLGLRPNQ